MYGSVHAFLTSALVGGEMMMMMMMMTMRIIG
jgi:hypothetical protein